MKPLSVADSIFKVIQEILPVLDITGCGALIRSIREKPYDPARVRAPLPALIVGIDIEPLSRALDCEPYPPLLEHMGPIDQVGFVIFNKANLKALPYAVRRDGSFGDIDCEVIVDDHGEIKPSRPLGGDEAFELLVRRWFRCVIDCFAALQHGTARMSIAPLEIDRRDHRERSRAGLPFEYLQLQPRI